ncbi:hypothetical protein [Desulfobacter curvatus]|uniref:hypothetical protein n=1 Tax=Desulfobacter curvatus TaxID=2290 RepID=UPI00037350BD|nr:hypothetical protein [Desulfobacter curvatus]
MSISNIQTVQGSYTSIFVQNNSNYTIASPRSTTESYTVNISETALELSRNVEAGEISTEISDEDLPVEAFAFPEWFSKWIPDEANVSDQLGVPLSSNNSLSSDRSDDLGEYVNTLLQYFQEELKNNGIDGAGDYYTSVLKNEETSEAVHQAVKDRISDDLRTQKLMQSFRKSLQ